VNEYTEREIELLKHIDTLTAAIEDAVKTLNDRGVDKTARIITTRHILLRGIDAVWGELHEEDDPRESGEFD